MGNDRLKVLSTGKTPEGYYLQIEYWGKDYPTVSYLLVAYVSCGGINHRAWSYEGGLHRIEFDIGDYEDSLNAFKSLESGEKRLIDYADKSRDAVLLRSLYIEE